MKFKLEIDTANEAFAGREDLEIARIMRDLAHRIIQGGLVDAQRVRDMNGNTCGGYTYER